MKRFTSYTFIIAALLLTVFLVSAVPLLAEEGGEAPTQNSGGLITGKLTNVGKEAGFGESEPQLAKTVGTIIKALLSIIGAIFMMYIIYGGYTWMTARGNEEQLSKAKGIIRNSIIGLIIVLGAYAITVFVTSNVSSATGYSPIKGSE